MKHLDIKIYGNVQDINFRSFLKAKARNLGVVGFARNDPDGAVYTEAEGEEKFLSEYLNYCQEGPGFARVEKVEINEGKVVGYKSFNIKH